MVTLARIGVQELWSELSARLQDRANQEGRFPRDESKAGADLAESQGYVALQQKRHSGDQADNCQVARSNVHGGAPSFQ